MERWNDVPHEEGENQTDKKTRRWNTQGVADGKMEEAFDRYARLLTDRISSFGFPEPGKGQCWFDSESVLWPRPYPKGSYSGQNALMLMMHCQKEGYRIPVFMTRERIMSLNYQRDADGRSVSAVDEKGERLPFVHVSKGERSFPLIVSDAVVTDRHTREVISYHEYAQKKPDEQKGYDVAYTPSVQLVFNVDQTNIPEARPDLYARLQEENRPRLLEVEGPNYRFDAMDCIIDDGLWLCDIKRSHLSKDFYYDVRAKAIHIPAKQLYAGGNDYYSRIFQKMVVSAIDSSLVRSDSLSEGGSEEYARRELIAELGSALLCQRYGIRKHLDEESARCRDRWQRSLRSNPDYGRSVLRTMKECTSLMSIRIDCVQKILPDMERKDDLREDGQSQGMDVNGDGVVDAGDTHYSPDRKQGAGEGKCSSEEEPHLHASHRSR